MILIPIIPILISRISIPIYQYRYLSVLVRYIGLTLLLIQDILEIVRTQVGMYKYKIVISINNCFKIYLIKASLY